MFPGQVRGLDSLHPAIGQSDRDHEFRITRCYPGALAKACRQLADAGVNIDAVMPTGMEGDDVTVAFITGDPAKARDILSRSGPAAARR